MDTENALFYNLGQSSFTKSAGHALSFSTLNATQTARVLNGNGFPQFLHYYQYRVTPAQPWDRKPAASWKDVPLFSLRGDHSPFDYWLAMRENLSLIHLHNDQEIKGDFGLDIGIESPETTALNLATPIKSLLDGVICAFHRMPALVDRDRLHISASRLRCPVDLLIDSTCSLLGERAFVRPTQKHVLWDPQDMLCKEARLTIRYGRPRWQFSGALYPI